jgi:signal transduction histidine kinase
LVDPLDGRRICEIAFLSDPGHRIAGVEGALAPMLVGLALGSPDPFAPARCDRRTARAFAEQRPVQAGVIEIDGAPVVAGRWRLDAAPRFQAHGGAFLGYRGALRRPAQMLPGPESSEDRVRQLLHELRTPLNAIQGFAELVEQQVLAPTPEEYRWIATSIVADSAAVLAKFAELEKLDFSADGQFRPARDARMVEAPSRGTSFETGKPPVD